MSVFKLGDVLREPVRRSVRAPKGLLQLLHVVRSKVDRRHGDVGHAEHDPFVGPGAGGLTNAILGGAKTLP